MCALNRGQRVPKPQQHPSLCPTPPRSDQASPFAAAAPSFADMGNAIGALIALGKGQGQEEEEEDSVLLSEEHSLILTCCWVSVKVGICPHGTGERGSPAPAAQPAPAAGFFISPRGLHLPWG